MLIWCSESVILVFCVVFIRSGVGFCGPLIESLSIFDSRTKTNLQLQWSLLSWVQRSLSEVEEIHKCFALDCEDFS